MMAGCAGGKQSNDDLIIVDVTKNYPEMKLILQDFMEVEYISLETTDEFLTQGVVKTVGKEILLVTNRTNDGDIFVFDRTGKGLRKINRKGQGGEEYLYVTEIVLDEDNSEMFIIDSPSRKILVYDLSGNFKRSFKFADTSYYTYVFNYDRDHLICHKKYDITEFTLRPCHLLISKQDGSIAQEIEIPYKEVKKPVVIGHGMANGEGIIVMPSVHQIILSNGNFALVELSSDTVYNYSPDGTISPFIVRTPSIYSIDPEVFLYPSVLTDRYYFMQTLTKKYDFEKMRGFPYNELMYDRKEKALFEYIVYNDDFSNRKPVNLRSRSVNDEIAVWHSLEACQLVESYEEGELKGKLKEIATTLDEEDNPVIVLIKHRKP